MQNRLFYSFGFLLIGIIFAGNILGFGENIEYRTLDLFRTPHPPHPDIVIAAIDNKSIAELGRWPWDRKVHADFLKKLEIYNPRSVAFDINFSERQNEENDNALEEALRNVKFPVILAAEAIYLKGYNEPERILTPIFSSTLLGHVNVPENTDGVMRKFPRPLRVAKQVGQAELLNIQNETFLPLSFQAAKIAGANVPEKSDLLIDFAGSAGSFQTISYSDILSGKVEGELLANKIILVGATASDLRDHLFAPVQDQILAGIEWHANVIDNILLSRFLEIAPKYSSIILGLAIWILLLTLPLSIKTNYISIIFAGIVVGLPLLSFGLWRSGIAFPFFINFLGATLVFVARSFYKWYQTEIEKRRLHKTIQNRFSPQVINAILKDPKLLKLGGERKEVTVLFSDIRSFTTISESIDPETLSALLHEYFTEMTEEVLTTDGVLDKFIGDAVMAFWGAPIEQNDQTDRAVKTALGMLRRLKVLQEKWKKEGLPFVDIGIGIHTGIVTVGNMGSEKRFDYTVIGDTVNAASRLEGLNKEYKTHLIISEATLKKLKMEVETKPLGEVVVKGKKQGINIFEISE